MNEWQPIKTAPSDQFILVWDGRRMMVIQAEQHALQWHWTHWMPLPDPPERT